MTARNFGRTLAISSTINEGTDNLRQRTIYTFFLSIREESLERPLLNCPTYFVPNFPFFPNLFLKFDLFCFFER